MLSRAKIASFVTVVALGALAAVALASGSGGDPAAVQTQDDVAKPKVRTEIVRQTIHRRAKAESSPSGGGSSSGSSHSSNSGRGSSSRGPGSGAATRSIAPATVVQAVPTVDDHGGRGGDDDGPDHDAFDDHGGDDHSGSGGGGDDDGGRGRGRGRGGDDD